MPCRLELQHRLTEVNCTPALSSAKPNTLQTCTSRSGSVHCRSPLCAQAPHSPPPCRRACEHRLSTGCCPAQLPVDLKLSAIQRPAALRFQLMLTQLPCIAGLRFEDAMVTLERCSTSMFQPMELFPLFPEATSPWKAHLPVKPYWGLHQPLTDLPALVRRGLRRQHRLNGASRSSSEAGSSGQDSANQSEVGRSQQVGRSPQVGRFQVRPTAIHMVSFCSSHVVNKRPSHLVLGYSADTDCRLLAATCTASC